MKTFYLSLVLAAATAQGQQQHGSSSMCWSLDSNPFRGVPVATRVDRSTVRVDWSNTFVAGDGPECADVDFLIRSHPRFQPSAYKLADFAPRGHKSAVLQIDGGTDYVFQVIAREDKGQRYGIDYKYSKMVTSYATDFGGNSGQGRQPVPQQPQMAVPRPQQQLRPQLSHPLVPRWMNLDLLLYCWVPRSLFPQYFVVL